MKVPILISVLCFALAQSALADASQVPRLYRQGLAAMERGDITLARAKFTKVLELDPKHGNARFKLIQLKKSQNSLLGKAQKLKLKQVILKEVDFHDAPLADALTVISSKIEKNSKQKVNFVVKDPAKKLDGKKVTLKLKQIPATVAIDYCVQAVGASVTYGKYAIEIRPVN